MSSRGYRNFFKWGVGGTGVAYKYTNSIYLSYAFIKKTMSLLYPPMLFFIFIYMILLYKQRFSYWDRDKGQRGQRYWYLFDIVENLCVPFKTRIHSKKFKILVDR
jgi:fucose 4-O-acetylase-like acetyltransferase